jgi:hypothetical protein
LPVLRYADSDWPFGIFKLFIVILPRTFRSSPTSSPLHSAQLLQLAPPPFVFSLKHLLFKLFNYYCHFLITPSNGKTNIITIAHVIKTKYDLWLMMIHSTFNNISAISLWWVLLVEEIGIFGENGRPVTIHQETVSHNVLSSTPRQLLVVISTYCIARCKSNYPTLTALQNKTK